MRIKEFEITGDPCNLLNSQITLFFALNHIYSKSRHSCSKSDNFCLKLHHFCSILCHFCFEYKMRCKSLFVSAFQQTAHLTNKVLVLTEFCDFKVAVIKWWLNFMSCNFGLKSYLWFQTKLNWFWNQSYDFIPHCTPISSVTIIYHQVQGCHKFWAAGIDFQLLQAQFNDGLRVVSIQVLDFVISALTSHTCTL